MFVAKDATFSPLHHAALSGVEAIRAYYAELFADRNFGPQCRQDVVEISGGSNLRWIVGNCDAALSGSDGKAVHDTSEWVKVWGKQPDGAWKCARNIWNSNLVLATQ